MRRLHRYALLGATLIAAALATVVRAEPPTPPAPPVPVRVVELTEDEAKTASTLLSFACKASPGESLDVCDAASGLRRKVLNAPIVEPPAAKPATGAGGDKDKFPAPER